MSQLQQLRDQIIWFASQTQTTAAQLETYQSVFDREAAEVQALIGGSAQGSLNNVLAAIEEAKQKLDVAVAALHAAADEASRYGDSM